MELIKEDDPRYFTHTSDEVYCRHHYKIVTGVGDSIVVDNWQDAQMIWFQKGPFLSYIEVLDKQVKGFK
jgi:hypothetical protein